MGKSKTGRDRYKKGEGRIGIREREVKRRGRRKEKAGVNVVCGLFCIHCLQVYVFPKPPDSERKASYIVLSREL